MKTIAKTIINKERVMKAAIASVFGVALYMGVSCSPVKFTSQGNACTVASPCVTAAGLMEVDQTFQFNNSNKVDILVVDDNSGSMTTEQENLGNTLNGFITNLMNANSGSSNLDWQVAVTNTDVCGTADSNLPAGFCPGPSNVAGAQGQIMGPLTSLSSIQYGNQFIITPFISNPAQTFYNTVQRQTQIGSGDERAIYAVNLAIDQASGSDNGFFRSNSNLAVVILSDEDERSVGGTCTDSDPADPTQYSNTASGQCDPGYASLENYDLPATLVTKVQQTWSGAKSLVVNSIIVVPDDNTQYPDPNRSGALQTCLELQSHQGPYYTAHPGKTYQQLSQMTGGVVGSICDNGQGAFAQVLSNIAGSIINQPNSNVVTLAHTASTAPIVTFTPQGNAVNWTWSGNQVTFSQRPVSGTSVDISYTYSN